MTIVEKPLDIWDKAHWDSLVLKMYESAIRFVVDDKKFTWDLHNLLRWWNNSSPKKYRDIQSQEVEEIIETLLKNFNEFKKYICYNGKEIKSLKEFRELKLWNCGQTIEEVKTTIKNNFIEREKKDLEKKREDIKRQLLIKFWKFNIIDGGIGEAKAEIKDEKLETIDTIKAIDSVEQYETEIDRLSKTSESFLKYRQEIKRMNEIIDNMDEPENFEKLLTTIRYEDKRTNKSSMDKIRQLINIVDPKKFAKILENDWRILYYSNAIIAIQNIENLWSYLNLTDTEQMFYDLSGNVRENENIDVINNPVFKN